MSDSKKPSAAPPWVATIGTVAAAVGIASISDAREWLELAKSYDVFVVLVLAVVIANHLLKRKDYELHEARGEFRTGIAAKDKELRQRTDQLIENGKLMERALTENTSTVAANTMMKQNILDFMKAKL